MRIKVLLLLLLLLFSSDIRLIDTINIAVALEKDSQITLDVLTEISQDNDEIIFNWQIPVNATVFLREDKLWVIFDKEAQVKFINVKNATSSLVATIQQLPLDTNTSATFIVLEIKNRSNSIASVKRDGNKWIIKISADSKSGRLMEDIKQYTLYKKTTDEKCASVCIDFYSKYTNLISYTDPFVGDDISVVPESDAVSLDSHSFVDFALFDTLTGIALQHLNDDLTLTIDGKTLCVLGKTFLNISNTASITIKNADDFDRFYYSSDSDNIIINVNDYMVDKNDFMMRLRNIYTIINQASDIDTKVNGLLNLSLFLFANGWYNEANTVFKLAYHYNNGNIGDSYIIKTFAVAINFMCGDFTRADEIARSIHFDLIPIRHRSEVNFWSNLSKVKVQSANSSGNLQYTIHRLTSKLEKHKQNFLSHYSDYLIDKIAFSVVDTATTDNITSDALALIRFLSARGLERQEKNHLSYYLGLLLKNNGSSNAARSNFDICSLDHTDVYLYVRCNFERINSMFKSHEITRRDYINELQKLSAIWRGDGFELQILSTLASTYYDGGDIPNAIRIWQTIFLNKPDTTVAFTAIKQAGQAFSEYFLQHNNSPLRSLAFFYEFKNMLPLGEDGDNIIIKIAYYMIDLDLLDDAARVMHYQIKNRLLGINREKIINALTNVYIKAGKAESAIQVVDQYTNFPFNMNNPLFVERKYLYARALMESKQYMDMFALLYDDNSIQADDVRSTGFFASEDWVKFNDSSEPYLYSIRYRDRNNKLSVEDNLKILKQAISYFNITQIDLLKNLYLDFRPMLVKDRKYTNKIKLFYRIANDLQSNNVITDKEKTNELKNMIKRFISAGG